MTQQLFSLGLVSSAEWLLGSSHLSSCRGLMDENEASAIMIFEVLPGYMGG